MSKYNFYYDESEHSRKINYKTISASNYYDNFVTMIIGWSTKEDNILQRYAAFETKYENRKDRNGEIKSTMLSKNNSSMGLHPSTNKTHNLHMIFCHFLTKIFIFTFLFPVR